MLKDTKFPQNFRVCSRVSELRVNVWLPSEYDWVEGLSICSHVHPKLTFDSHLSLLDYISCPSLQFLHLNCSFWNIYNHKNTSFLFFSSITCTFVNIWKHTESKHTQDLPFTMSRSTQELQLVQDNSMFLFFFSGILRAVQIFTKMTKVSSERRCKLHTIILQPSTVRHPSAVRHPNAGQWSSKHNSNVTVFIKKLSWA